MSKKLSKKEQLHQEDWLISANEFNLCDADDEIINVRKLVDLADGIQTKICNLADHYKIDIFENMKNACPNIEMSKNQWIDVVSLRRMKVYNTISEKTIKKMKSGFNKVAYSIALKSASLSHFSNEMPEDSIQLPVTNEDLDVSIEIFENEKQSDEFIQLVNQAADIQHEIKTVLYPQLHQLSNAFSWITKLSGGDFKTLVDVTHYRYGGYPTENAPPRHWGVFKRYRYINILMNRFEFDHASMWNQRFGISSEFTQDKHFSWNIFTKDAEKWVGINVWKPSIDAFKENTEIFKNYGIESWHIIAEYDNYCFIIDETTSTIEKSFHFNELEYDIPQGFTKTIKFENFYGELLVFSENCSDLCKTLAEDKLSNVLLKNI